MQGPEEFCRKIDMKLRRSVISTFAVLFAVVCGAAVLMYKFAPIDDFMVDMFMDGSVGKGSGGDFLMAMVQSDSSGTFSVTGSDLSDGIFTAVICGENRSAEDMVLTPADIIVYSTDVLSGGQPGLCRTNMTENVVIPAGLSVEFSVSADVPEGFSYEECKVSVIISAESCGKKYGLMLN
ncbi:MAG: hypothetical protein ACI4J0_09560 [Huintestinicola sp.]|uniref:hypothetical protein n=1 Tax=Huintestinicola sp. TaxID=2981661 RepID=UPI003F09A7ED